MKHGVYIVMCWLLLACNSTALPYQEAPTRYPYQEAPTRYFPVHFYVENGSETQPATDLLTKWDTTVVAQDTFRYTGVGDLFDTYSLLAKSGLHRIKVTNTQNRLVRDTTIEVDTLTHVFISFVYTALGSVTLKRIELLNPPEEQAAIIDALSELKRLVIFSMRGPISIP